MSEQLERRLVAVMFTDMVGYTALVQADERVGLDMREHYLAALERHHDAFGGTVVQRLGDGSMSMFPSALAAVRAAVAMQQELAEQDVRARVGIHVGEVIVEPERLTGDAVNIAARIESFAVAGGVLLSDDAYAQLRNRDDVAVVPLGQFRLKHVGKPLELYAVAAEGLVVPEPESLEGKGDRLAGLPGNLPAAATPLVGRGADLASVSELARSHRVVTITGPGGVGKTRVLSELGRLLAAEFPGGLAFVAFSDVTEPGGFVPALAEALDVKEAEGRTLGEGIETLLGNRKALLLLDNLEQIVAVAAAEVARLVDSCPELLVVTTSRMPLRIAAEHEYQLAPLETGPAVSLFVARAPSLELTSANQAVVAAVCRRLDGLSLALELAAARLRLLTPEALLERLDHALDLLTSGSRDAPGRQQTLRATIEWSHSLLDEREQRLFRRLAVFAGGSTVEDAEAVCEANLDELESLVDKALVQANGRLLMLETIREYASEQLDAAREADEVAARHAHRYAEVARDIRDGVEGSDQLGALKRGIAEEGNLQAALDTLLAAARGGDEAAAELGMQLCGDLWMYWHIRGKNLTARDYAAAFLDTHAGAAATAGRAGALRTAALAAWMLGDIARADAQWGEAYDIASAVGAERELCLSSLARTLALLGVDNGAARRWAREGVERSAALGFSWGEGFALAFEGLASTLEDDLAAALSSFDKALAIQKRLGDEEGAGISLGGLAQLAVLRGDLGGALGLYAQALEAFEACGDRAEEARILSETAWTHLRNEDPGAARGLFSRAAQAYDDVWSVRGVGLSLIGLAATEAVEDRPEQAVQIAAAAEVYAQEEGIVNVYSDETPGREFVDRARAALSASDLARATEVGRRLTIEEALDLARLPREALAP